MINLLPTELREEYVYARRNKHLRNWVVILGIVLLGAVLLTAGGWMYLEYSGREYEKQIAASQKSLEEQNYTAVQKDVQDMSNNLELAVQVLSKQVLFSKLLTRIGSLMPRDTRLTALSITQAQDAIDISARAKTYNAATQVAVNLTGSNPKLFTKADIISINCESSGKEAYPCTVTLRALLVADNPFLFINDSKTGVVQ